MLTKFRLNNITNRKTQKDFKLQAHCILFNGTHIPSPRELRDVVLLLFLPVALETELSQL